MRMAKAPEEHIDLLRIWMQFNDELFKIDPKNKYEWDKLKEDWVDDEAFSPLIKQFQDLDGNFEWEYYTDYYNLHISHIHIRIIFGYYTLVQSCCDPDLDYLEYNKEIRELFNKKENEST